MSPVPDNRPMLDLADAERIAKLAAGGLLVVAGLSRGGVGGLLMKAAGAGLLYLGAKDHPQVREALGFGSEDAPSRIPTDSIRVEAMVDIDRNPGEVYRVWRELRNLPLFLRHVVGVHEIDAKRSIWVVRAPMGTVVKWEAEIIHDVPGERLAWRSLQGADVDNAGTVIFEPIGEGGTRLRAVLRYDPPGRHVGRWIARMLGEDPQRQVEEDLRRFKRLVETASDAVPPALPEAGGTREGAAEAF